MGTTTGMTTGTTTAMGMQRRRQPWR